MQRTLALVIGLLLAATGAALDVPLRDGTVVTATSYRLTGSFIMIELENGAQVAYDVADVDLEALRAAEAAAQVAADEPDRGEATAEAEAGSESLVQGRRLKDPDAVGDEPSDGRTISDRDVRHVRRGGELGDDAAGGQEADGGVPSGYQEGGGVVLNNLRVSPLGEGRWRVEGEVANRLQAPVMDVRVRLEATPPDGEPWQGEVGVAGTLAPGASSGFQHQFAVETGPDGKQPAVRASVMWMQQETRREPDYTKAGGVPHPSNLPLEHGGVSGADMVRQPTPTPVE
jgi:hypothetical protein